MALGFGRKKDSQETTSEKAEEAASAGGSAATAPVAAQAAPVQTTEAPQQGDADAGAGEAAKPSEEERRRNATASRQRAATFGDLAMLAIQHNSYRNMAIADLDWLIGPAIMTGNFMIANATREDGAVLPIAAITWARVSEELDRRLVENLSRPFRLSPAEYVSGENYWIAHTFGHPRAVENLIQAAIQPAGKSEDGQERPAGPLAGKKLKQRVRDDSGRAVIMTLG